MPAKLTYNKVKQFFTDNNCKLITKNYINNKQKLEYIASCGHHNIATLIYIKCYKQFKCKKCFKIKNLSTRFENFSKNRKLKIDPRTFKCLIRKMNKEFGRCLKYRSDFSKENYSKKLKCWDCKKTKPLYLFPYRKQYKDNKEKRCKICNRENNRFRRKNLNKNQIIRTLLTSCKSSCKRRLKKKRFNCAVFNITEKDILELLKKQNNKCIYTGKELSWEANNNYKISIDRIDSSKGYIKNNIQLVGWIVNQAKSNLTNNIFLDMIKSIYLNKCI